MTAASSYQLLPPLTEEELARLDADIAAVGVRKPIHVDEHGAVLDGHHRKKLAAKYGYECPAIVLSGLSEEQKLDESLKLNLMGRTLSSAGKREVIASFLKHRPDASNLQIKKLTGFDDKTVAAVRRELESYSEIPNKTIRREESGRAARGRKPTGPTPEQIATKATMDAKRAAKRAKHDEKTAPAKAQQAADEAEMRAQHEAIGGKVAYSSRAPRRDRDLHERLISTLSTAILGLTQALNHPDLDTEFAAAERALPATVQVEASRAKMQRLLTQLNARLKASANGADSPLGEPTER